MLIGKLHINYPRPVVKDSNTSAASSSRSQISGPMWVVLTFFIQSTLTTWFWFQSIRSQRTGKHLPWFVCEEGKACERKRMTQWFQKFERVREDKYVRLGWRKLAWLSTLLNFNARLAISFSLDLLQDRRLQSNAVNLPHLAPPRGIGLQLKLVLSNFYTIIKVAGRRSLSSCSRCCNGCTWGKTDRVFRESHFPVIYIDRIFFLILF